MYSMCIVRGSCSIGFCISYCNDAPPKPHYSRPNTRRIPPSRTSWAMTGTRVCPNLFNHFIVAIGLRRATAARPCNQDRCVGDADRRRRTALRRQALRFRSASFRCLMRISATTPLPSMIPISGIKGPEPSPKITVSFRQPTADR